MKSVFRKKICACLVATTLILGSVTALAVPAVSAAAPVNTAKTTMLPNGFCGIGECCIGSTCFIGVCCHFTF